MQAMFHRMNPTQLTRTGLLMVAGSALAVVGFLIHPPEGVTGASAVASIEESPGVWAAAHVLLAVGFVAAAFGVFGLLRAGIRVTDPTWTCRAWKGLGYALFIAVPVPVIEAFVPWMKAGSDAAAYEALGLYQLPFLVLGFAGMLACAILLAATECVNSCPAGHKGFAILAGLGGIAGLVGVVGHFTQNEALVLGDFGYLAVFLYVAVAGVNSLRLASTLRAEAQPNAA